jgi:hypothetical protein
MSQIHSDPDALEVFVLEPGLEPVVEEHELELEEGSYEEDEGAAEL